MSTAVVDADSRLREDAGSRLRGLDALRGGAAMVVVFHHAYTLFDLGGTELARRAPLLQAVLAFISRRNVEAVLLFFVLSGFSIRLSLERHPLADAAAIRDYLRRRLLRILPLYWSALAVSAWVALYLAPISVEALRARTLLGNLLFLQTAPGTPGQWFIPYAGNGALWSLSFEMFFYLGYPLLVRGIAAGKRRTCAVLALSALGYACGELAPNPIAMFCAASLIWYFGVELAERYLHGRTSLPTWAYVLLWAGLLALRLGPHGATFHGAAVGCTMLLLGTALMSLASHRRERPTSLGLSTLTRLATTTSSRLAELLARLLAQLGDFSYALYLLHVPVLRAFVASLGHGWVSAFASVSCSLLISAQAERVTRRYSRARQPAPCAPSRTTAPADA